MMQTARLQLRLLTLEDAPGLLKIFSDEDTMFYTDIDPITSLEIIKEEILLMDNLLQKQHGIRWGIFKKTDDQLIGTCGYHKWDKVSHRAEVGYELGSPYWRQGYMSELFPSLLHYGFKTMELNRIEASVIKENLRSIKLLKKFGFKQEGVLRARMFSKGKYWDECWLSLLKRDA